MDSSIHLLLSLPKLYSQQQLQMHGHKGALVLLHESKHDSETAWQMACRICHFRYQPMAHLLHTAVTNWLQKVVDCKGHPSQSKQKPLQQQTRNQFWWTMGPSVILQVTTFCPTSTLVWNMCTAINLLQWTWLIFPMPDSAWIFLLVLLTYSVFQSWNHLVTQRCYVNEGLSTEQYTSCSIPQGSILGPLLFMKRFSQMSTAYKTWYVCQWYIYK